MFEQAFKRELEYLTRDKRLIEGLWLEIKNNYSTEGRHYHTIPHLNNLLAELLAVKDKISDWRTLIFSIAYHDIVYDPLANNNEEKSAELAYRKLSDLSVPDGQKQRCCAQIMTTKEHKQSTDADTNFFTDADLAIMGSPEEVYRQYSELIRKEYHVYPEFVYNTGRKKVLHHFLEMPHIYKTDFFRNKYESQARKNLKDELQALTRWDSGRKNIPII